MKVIAGLGNPGEKYSNTRHNIGFITLDKILEDTTPLKKTVWDEVREFKSLYKEVQIANKKILLIKTQTFMNNSGIAIKQFVDKYKIDTTDLTVIHDDVDLPIGKIRVRMGGAAGGHKGVMSIIESLGTDKFLRVRLGIGRPGKFPISNFKFQISKKGVEDYVLEEFEPKEKSKVRTMVKETIRIIRLISKNGIDIYMAKYNKK